MLPKLGRLFIFLLSVGPVFGQGHVPVLSELEGQELIQQLKTDFRPPLVLTYKDAREVLYRELFNRNDSVTCVYSGHQLYLDPNTGDAVAYLYRNGEANGINCEHTFPQSLGASDGNARSDMHHLFPARVAVNEARSNLPYSEIDDQVTERWFYRDNVMTRIPASAIDSYSEYIKTTFEPREDHKGNVARAMFYFATIYRDQADTVWFQSQLPDLCNWHLQDPVDEAEWDRNEKIATYQSDKRNPFVLDCTLAYRCYCPDTPPCEPQTPINNQFVSPVRLEPADQNGHRWSVLGTFSFPIVLQVHNVRGQIVEEMTLFPGQQTEINLKSNMSAGWYVIRLMDRRSGQFLFGRPFIVSEGR